MSDVAGLLTALNEKGIRLGLDSSGALRIRGNKSHLDDATVDSIRQSKSAIILLLRKGAPFELLTEAERARLAQEGEAWVDAYPLSALQAGMVFHSQLEQFTGIYHDIMAQHVRYRWDQERFEKALAACIEEHPILRSSFTLVGERPLQRVHAHRALPLWVEDLRGLDAEAQEQYLSRWMEERKRHVFDWETGELFAIHIFRRSDDSFQFVISFHHAVLDGWSRAVLTTELYGHYERLLAGEPLAPVQVNWTYRDFIAQEQAVLADPLARAHFQEMLSEAPALQLPRLGTAPAGASPAQGQQVLEPFTALSGRLIALARQLGVPVQSVLLAVHLKVLSAVSGQSVALTCVTHNGRPESAAAERAVGLFLNSVPLALPLTSGSWRELIHAIARLSTQNLQYRNYPLSRIQQDLGRTFSEVTFNYTHFHVLNEIAARNDGNSLQVLGAAVYEQTNFDFHVDVMHALGDETLRMVLIYDARVYEPVLIERLGDYYLKGFESLLGNLEGRHRDLSLLSGTERHQQLVLWNDTAKSRTWTGCVHELIEEQARRTPDSIAARHQDQALSYRQLCAKAQRLAAYLRAVGVQPQARVGLYLERGLEQLIAMLGIMKAGAAYVPLDPGYPASRIEYVLQDAQIERVLVRSDLMDRLPGGGVDVVLMDEAASDDAWLQEYSGEQTLRTGAADARALAYVLYTSGSTGQPKGVMVEHAGLMNYLAHCVQEYRLEALAGAVVSTPLSFDATVTSVWSPLLAGKTVQLLAEGEELLGQLLEKLYEDDTDWLFKLTPAHLEALKALEHGARVGGGAHRIVIGGEQLRVQTVRDWKRRLPRATFINEYGPTETVVGCSVYEVDTLDQLDGLDDQAGVPIGQPIANTTLYVLSESLDLLPVGSVGELYIGGAGVARGYLNRHDLTAERFIGNPFSSDPGARMYRSGDRVRWLPRGQLEYLGRSDEQVKIRGFRIELGEIEGQLRDLPGVRDAAVLAREDEPGQKRLVAYVVPDGEGHEHEYRQALQERLPQYMVPTAWVLLQVLPLTVNGKVDRKVLPAPEQRSSVSEYVAPRNPVEQALCAVWADVLARERVGIRENFFSIGGDSIQSIRVVSMLKAQGLKVSIRDLFEHQSIGELSAHVEVDAVVAAPLRPFELLSIEEREQLEQDEQKYVDAYPLSALQAGMVFHTQLEQFSGIYHDIMAQQVKCRWDQQRFERALAACIEEHPVLRSSFSLNGDRPLQRVHVTRALPLSVVDLRTVPSEQQEEQLAQWMESRQRHVFDWENGALFSIHIFRRTDQSFQFIVSFHHAVLDGWSRAVLTTELYARYQRLLAYEDPEPTQVDWTYRDFIAQEQAVLADGRAREHFKEMLEEAPVVQLPRQARQSIPEGEPRQGQWLNDDFAAMSGRAIEIARQMGVPLQSVLLAVHLKVLSFLSGQPVAMSCVTQNGRPETAGAERAVGLFLNSLPLALRLPSGSWRDLIHSVARMNTQNLRYRSYPLSQIQQDLGRAFDEVTFNYTHFHVYNEIAAGTDELQVLDSRGFELTNFPLTVDFARLTNEDRIRFALFYDRRLFAAEQIERIGHYYLRGFASLTADLDAPHQSARLLGPEELRQLQVSRNETARARRNVTLLEAFQEQVVRNPEAIALRSKGEELTYGDLSHRVAAFASALASRGVSRDSLVAVCAERSPELLIALLAIWKAGAAYVPIDPAYPPELRRFMLADCTPALLLTDQSPEAADVADAPVLDLRLAVASDPAGDSRATASPKADADPAHRAYVIYTSGSTGRPKGVEVSHASLMNYLEYAAREYELDRLAGGVVSTSLSFDATITTLFAPLLRGKAVCLLPEERQSALQALKQMLFASGPDWLFKLTPSHLELLGESTDEGTSSAARHVVVVGGEQLTTRTMLAWKGELLPNGVFVNEYGPTESTVGCCVFFVRGADDLDSNEAAVPIGKPIQNTRLYVANGEEATPIGCVGELYIGGEGLAIGYLGQPDLTASRFARHVRGVADTLYRTGDLVRNRADGNLEYIGRADRQVKVRGVRIEPGEIEHQLLSSGQVTRALVVAAADANGGASLVAYVVLSSEADSDETTRQLRESLRARLPAAFVPSGVVVLKEFPVTRSGKIDTSRLPPWSPVSGEIAFVAPRNDIERAVTETWQRVLGVARVGVHDNFFDLGGHSILAMRVASLLARHFSLDALSLPVVAVFANNTAEALAKHISIKLHALQLQRAAEALDASAGDTEEGFVE